MNIDTKRLSEIRNAKGLTQEELAEKSNINLRTIQRIENNESQPRGKTLKLICDALQLDTSEIRLNENSNQDGFGTKLVNGIFLLTLNLVLMGIIGFLTLDSNANINSVFGGCLLSIFLPFFIVVMTKKMNGMERMLKFGIGYIVYFIIVIIKLGFPTGFITGLFPCLFISLSVLYFGSELFKTRFS